MTKSNTEQTIGVKNIYKIIVESALPPVNFWYEIRRGELMTSSSELTKTKGFISAAPKWGRRVRNGGTNFYLICANCARRFPNLCPLHWTPIREKTLGAKEMSAPPNWAMALKMTAQISTQFVPIVLQSSKICTPFLLSLFTKQVWGG